MKMFAPIVTLSCLLGSALAEPQVFSAPAYAPGYAPGYAYASGYSPALYAPGYSPAVYASGYAPAFSYFGAPYVSPYFHQQQPYYSSPAIAASVDTHPLNQPDNYPYFYLQQGQQASPLPQFVADSSAAAVVSAVPAGLTYAPTNPFFSASPLYLSYASTAVSSENSGAAETAVSPDFDEEVVEAGSSKPVAAPGTFTLRNIIPIFESDLRTNDILYVKPGDSEATEAVEAAAASTGAVVVE